MIVPWINNRTVTPLITCELHRINKWFCRIHNKLNIKMVTVFFFLELLTRACYSSYPAYLLIGGLWLLIQTPVVLFFMIKEKSFLDTFPKVKQLPAYASRTEYRRGKKYLVDKYVRLIQEYNSNPKTQKSH